MPRCTHPARQLPSGAFIKQYLLSVFLELSPLPLTFVSMGSQDGPCASVPSSGRAEYVVNGFTLTSDRVITSFQDTEGPAAKSWTSLLKGKEESPEVSEGLSRTTEPLYPLSPAASGGL